MHIRGFAGTLNPNSTLEFVYNGMPFSENTETLSMQGTDNLEEFLCAFMCADAKQAQGFIAFFRKLPEVSFASYSPISESLSENITFLMSNLLEISVWTEGQVSCSSNSRHMCFLERFFAN
jgi:hypothetical protein